MASDVVRFNRVLRVREVERDISQSELAEKMTEEERILRGLNEMQDEKESALADFCSGQGRVVSPQQMWFERQSLDVMEKKLDSQRTMLNSCRVEIEEKKDELLERHRNVQLMGKHVDKLKARDFKKAIDAEQSNLDDITTMRWLRSARREASV